MLKKLNIPKGWEKGTVGDLARGIRGVTFSSEDILSSDEPTAVVLLRSNNIKDSRINFDEVYLLPSAEVSEDQIARAGDVAVCMSNGSKRLVGKAARLTAVELQRKVSVGAFCALFRPTSGADNNFVPYLFDTESYRRELDITLAGSAINNLKNSDIEGIKIPLPPLAEQRKIAEILRTWDEAIETAEAELKSKQERKQWLIAKVLKSSSNEAGAVGVKKAPTERLGKLCDICTGKKDANEGSPDGVYPFFTCAERHGFSESYSFDAEAILVAGNANIGRTNFYKGKFEAYQRTYVLTGFRGVDVPYLYSLLSARLELDLKNQAQRSAMSYIRLPMLEDYQIPLPPIAEQRKIAEIMKCADLDIGVVDKHLESLRAQKRGLMQKLLTGEVRVAA